VATRRNQNGASKEVVLAEFERGGKTFFFFRKHCGTSFSRDEFLDDDDDAESAVVWKDGVEVDYLHTTAYGRCHAALCFLRLHTHSTPNT